MIPKWFIIASTVILWAEIVGLLAWIFAMIPMFIIDSVWRASQILIGFHFITPATLYLIREYGVKNISFVKLYPLFVTISFLVVIGTDTLHLFGVVSEYNDLYVHANENNRSRSIYILELVLASYFSLMTASAVTITVLLYLGSR
jgi:hypothetical protein